MAASTCSRSRATCCTSSAEPVEPALLHPELGDCRRLFLRNYEVHIRIGAHEAERLGPQRVRINVELFVPLAVSTPHADRLDEVLDYDFIRAEIDARVAEGHIDLQETLADDLLRRMLAHPGVRAASVTTEKPDVYPDCEAVGVQVFAWRRDDRPQGQLP
jgi:7,8-dihydroneopterin aldolase/epimerase/oxygenase